MTTRGASVCRTPLHVCEVTTGNRYQHTRAGRSYGTLLLLYIAIVACRCYVRIVSSYRHTLLTDFKIATARRIVAIKRARFDGDAFFAAPDGERQARLCTWKRVAEERDVSASTLTCISQGKPPRRGLPCCVAGLVWLGG